MAKNNKIPKKIAGYKVPKAIRSSSLVKSLMASDVGRGILANALKAAAGAAAAALISERGEIAEAGGKGVGKGKRALGIAGTAMSHAADAAMEVVKGSAHDALPKKFRKGMKYRPQRGAVH
jgi:hypothetical protein